MRQIRNVVWGIGSLLAVQSSQAALLGVNQNFDDITLGNATLVYDRNLISTSVGVLRIYAASSSLSKGPGNTAGTQLYLGSGDSSADLMLSFAINTSGSAAGTLCTTAICNTFNKVNITLGNAAASQAGQNAFGFSWLGKVTQFGFTNNGSAFDARWAITSDSYELMPVTYSYLKDGARTGFNAGLKISNTQAPGNNWWTFDWVRGAGVNADGTINSLISNFVSTLDAGFSRQASTVSADVFVPLPAAGLLLLTGLAAFVPRLKRRASVAA